MSRFPSAEVYDHDFFTRLREHLGAENYQDLLMYSVHGDGLKLLGGIVGMLADDSKKRELLGNVKSQLKEKIKYRPDYDPEKHDAVIDRTIDRIGSGWFNGNDVIDLYFSNLMRALPQQQVKKLTEISIDAASLSDNELAIATALRKQATIILAKKAQGRGEL